MDQKIHNPEIIIDRDFDFDPADSHFDADFPNPGTTGREK